MIRTCTYATCDDESCPIHGAYLTGETAELDDTWYPEPDAD